MGHVAGGLSRPIVVALGIGLSVCLWFPHNLLAANPDISNQDRDRSPVDLRLSQDEEWLVTANQTADTVSLVEVASGRVAREIACGAHPSALASHGETLLVTCRYAGTLERLRWRGASLEPAAKIALGFEPLGVAISPDGKVAYVALTSAAEVAVVDLERNRLVETIPVGRWPRYLALSLDGARLAVNCSGDRSIAVVDTQSRKLLFANEFYGINTGQMQVSSDGQYVYFPWMIYRQNPINQRNIRLGWVLGSRIARVRMDEKTQREAITLDPRGQAVSDPHGLALTSDEQWLVATASGTHELLIYRLPGLPFQSTGGPGDHIDRALAADEHRFSRVPLGGRPMGLRIAKDNRRAFIANYLSNSVQVVDLERRAVERSINLGGPAAPSLARRGEAIFYDGGRTLDQWYSCHSCHYDGGSNAVTMDTNNDGSYGTFKTVPALHNVTRTAPWTWHGWQTDLKAGVRKSLTETMLGPPPTDEDVRALIAYFDQMHPAPNPHRKPDGSLSDAARRGEQVFTSDKAGCANCHRGPEFTDGEIHDVGLGSPKDVYQGFNTPSLRGVYNKVRLLHNGHAQSIREAVQDLHAPRNVTGRGELSADELADLVEYVKSL
jgi:DNA-binding beta-propeller fold protein YncE/mono/diheme cytochrome c family protein